MRSWITGLLVGMSFTPAFAARPASCSIIPAPQKCESREGAFKLKPDAQIFTDAAARATGQYLAERLRPSTGFQMKVADATEAAPVAGSIILTTDKADASKGAESYELTVGADSVVIRAADAAGVFYGVQSLLQLLPPQIFSSRLVTQVEWQVPGLHIEDQPRFKWRGMLLDGSRHFFDKNQVERVFDLMALHKMNMFQWHLTDHDGWRPEIKKYPRLTQDSAWRADIGYGLDPRSSKAYGPDGRYGGFFTQDDIREMVAYAQSRHITIVPEIEMPGHSGAACDAYPELICDKTDGSGPARQIGVICPGKDGTYTFEQNVLTEIFALFPSKYIHIGGDEVDKDNWKKCPKCQARMKQENLKDEHDLQSYFVRRIEKFINANGRTMVGWSEIRQGGIAQNAVLMDWIGGALESATEGHDVVMTPTSFCYFDYYQSLNQSIEPRGIGGYVPLRKVYSFEPVPEKLPAELQPHILGAQANLWAEFIASPKHLEFMLFPRLCAMSEVAWSAREQRNWEDFNQRLGLHTRRLDQLGVNYFEDTSTEVGTWSPAQVKSEETAIEWDVTKYIGESGKYHIAFDHIKGHGLRIGWVALLENGKEVSRDTHAGIAGGEGNILAFDETVYILSAPAHKRDAKYILRAGVTGEGGTDSSGSVKLDAAVRRPIR